MSDQSAPDTNRGRPVIPGMAPPKKSHHKINPEMQALADKHGAKIGAESAASDPAPGNPKAGGKEPSEYDKLKDAAIKRKVATGPTDKAIKESVETLYGFAAMGFSIVDSDIGNAIAKCTEDNPYGPSAPEAWVELARQYPAVRRAIASVGGVGTIGQLMVAHTPLFMVLSAKFSPQSFFGANVVPPVGNPPAPPEGHIPNFPTAPDPVVVR